MKTPNCKTCLFEDICPTGYGCSFHAATDESPSDEEVSLLVEEGRDEYRRAWFQYTLEGFEF